MSKTRSFSIYLLKDDFDATNALRQDHALRDTLEATGLPDNSVLFVLDSEPRAPWWRSYFGIEQPLSQMNKGALIFLQVEERCFALSFGHVAHNLLDTSYEYDFGLRVTLNSLDPTKLKSTDTLEPGAAKRQRTQLPIESELTFFDFDRDSTVLRSLTGKVKDEFKEFFKHATGASNLRISSDVQANGLVALCKQLLLLYQADDYKIAFPEIQNIVPVRDPAQLDLLNNHLLGALRAKNPDLNMTVPEIINYSDNLYAAFSGVGESLIYDDVYIGRYYDYLEAHNIDLGSIDLSALKRHDLVLTDEAGGPRDRYSVFKSLVFDLALAGAANDTFHLCEGHWFKIDNDYITRLGTFLDPRWVDCDLPPYDHTSEGDYNKSVSLNDDAFICLDRENIGPARQSQVEPCDLLTKRNGTADFYHVKVSTLSAQLSHLFNQGVNAIELLRLEIEATKKLNALIRDHAESEAEAAALIALIRDQKCRVIFAIVTRKNADARSRNLPLFSRISLMRSMKALQLMNIAAHYVFVEDRSDNVDGRKKQRKRKAVVRAMASAAAEAA
jgi:uncharacterized protein (TIGR04141 family)